ncbi:tyrosine-type recombinase/integrase [Patescibacteria group bacterium]|nr:tyrosine-type recombinase/integrase [Patescibacteria group bacterium]MBU1673042.1 tyrosine-type recombinase/integrase [Patescibacteria group bacterium]MBU1963602.1 tyrosine-type recombinase/integrase [Patescibacteria group bacterium]
MKMKTIIQKYLKDLTTEGRLSQRTLQSYGIDLEKFCEFNNDKDVDLLEKEDIRKFTDHLRDQENSNTSIARKLSSLRGFFGYLEAERITSFNPMAGIKSPKIIEKEPSFLSLKESQALIQAVKKKATPYYRERDLAIVQLFLSTGIRLRELTGLEINDIDLINKRMRITRKGGNEQFIPLRDDICLILQKYIDVRRDISHTDAFFISRKYNGIRPNTVYCLIKKYLRLARIQKEDIGVHSLRHTVATNLHGQGVDLISIKKLLGHKRITSTEIYTHINDDDLIQAVNQINI